MHSRVEYGSNVVNRQPAGVSGVLLDLLTEETIALAVQAADWRAAIRASGELLVQSGAVAPGYVDAMVRAMEVKGPYMVVAPGVALPHAGMGDGATRVAFSVARMAAPVDFGNSPNSPVDLVMTLCSPDAGSHVMALVQLSLFLESKDHVDKLRHATDKAGVMAAFRELLG